MPQIFPLMIFALGWNIVGGYTGLPAFGNGAFFGIGAYVTVLLSINLGIPPIAGVWLAALVAMFAALLIGLFSLRFRDIYFALASTAFPLVLGIIVTYLNYAEVSFPFKPGTGIEYFGFGSLATEAWISAAFVVAVVFASSRLERSHTGLLLNAIRGNEYAASACGVPVERLKISALIGSAAICAVAGALYAAATLVLTPDVFFGLLVSIQPAIFTLIGGNATVWGPLIGTAILVPLESYLTLELGSSVPSIGPLIYGSAVIIVVLAFPGGIYWQARRLVRALIPATRVGSDPIARSDRRQSPQALAAAAPHDESHSDEGARLAAATEPTRVLLEISDLSKTFGGGLVVLDRVSFDVRQGEILGVIGPNGAGKTTLFEIVSGFVRADQGSVRLNDRELLPLKPYQVCRAGIGRTFQTPRLFSGMSVADSVEVAARSRLDRDEAVEAIARCLDLMQLTSRATAAVDSLTTGEVRRLELARAIVGFPAVVLLDEFLGGVGGEEAALIMSGLRSVRDQGSTIVAIEHTMHAMLSLVDRFVVLNLGRVLASGTAAEIANNEEVIKAYLGERWAQRAAD
jgi:branched-chain amino acid transport system permease protein